MAVSCMACGSPSQGSYVCFFCGAATHSLANPSEERAALDELHGRLISSEKDKETILKNAFLPTTPEVLMDAGLRLLPILEDNVAEDGAAGRLRAIIVKLELMRGNEDAAHVAKELRQALEDYRRSDRNMGYVAIALIVGTLAALVYWLAF